MKKVFLYILTTTVLIPLAGIILALNWKPVAAMDPTSCTRYCHDKGCPHEPLLPDFIAGNAGYFGDVISWLYSFGDIIGSVVGLSRAQGYGAANLLVFCIAVPALHFLLMFLSLRLCRTP